MPPEAESMSVAVRAFAEPHTPAQPWRGGDEPDPLPPSDWALVFDTETFTDAAQQFRFSAYQLRQAGESREAGLFYDPLSLTDAERSTLYAYAKTHGHVVRSVDEFVEEVFFPYVYDLDGLCVGFNLPFDLARLAVHHASARGTMRGGFTLRLSPDEGRPWVQVKHLTGRAALIRFTKPRGQDTPRGMRNRALRVPTRRGLFADVRTLAGALLGGSWTLKALADHLQTEHRKREADEHGGPLTDEYLAYAVQDVQATWECFAALRQRYEGYGLTRTPLTRIYSEASLGKACLREMGVVPWRELQPDVPPALLGTILSTYYGGRSEVHLRRVVSRVLYCDFLSMYPTVCTLMGLWDFVIAGRVAWADATAAVQAFLDRVTAADLQRPETWRELRVLVHVLPDADIFPVRAAYGGEGHYTIGLNYLTSERPLWFTLADCVASKLLTGKAPTVCQAVRFNPEGVQAGLRPIDILGNPAYRVDPARDDFYKRLIDLRTEVKAKATAEQAGDAAGSESLDAEQRALKITANATSYGIFVELNVTEHAALREVACHGPAGDGFSAWVRNIEEPGRCFHPLLGTLITGAARLMLALTERLARDAGLTWAFCDTDSMALARPDGMVEADFLAHVQRVRDWFSPLNPYVHKGPLLKSEGANYRLRNGTLTAELEPLSCFAVSAKRYVLFNLDGRGRPVLRKASAHALGHLRPPYREDQAPLSIPEPAVSLKDLGVERWQHDLWYRIVEAALAGRPDRVRLDDLPGFDAPAVSRYAATTPTLLRWFDAHNRGRPYRERVRPFGFLLAFQVDPLAAVADAERIVPSDDPSRAAPEFPRPVAPYDADPVTAGRACFDRLTGRPIPVESLKTYRQALAQYHLHPEAKFAHADYRDRGPTARRHILATAVEHIGKEANRWEEQLYLGEDPEAQIVYGTTPEDRARLRGGVLRAGRRFGQSALAEAAGVSAREVGAILRGERTPTRETLERLVRAVPRLEAAERARADHEQAVLDAVRERCRDVSMRRFAALADVHYPHLTEVLTGRRKPSAAMLERLEAVLLPVQYELPQTYPVRGQIADGCST